MMNTETATLTILALMALLYYTMDYINLKIENKRLKKKIKDGK